LKHDRSTAETQETAILYALGSLGLHEARAFEIHLAEGCPVCESELRRFEKTVAGIGLAAAEAEPPEYLRDLLLTRIEREARSTPEPQAPAKEEISIPQPATEVVDAPKKSPAPISPPLFSSMAPPPERNYLPWALVAICALIAVVAFYAWKQADKIMAQRNDELRKVQEENSELRTLLDIQQKKTQELEQINAILGAPASRFFSMVGQPPASLIVLWDTQKNQWLVTGYLSPAPEGKTYRVWLLSWSSKANLGSLKPDVLGRVFTSIDLPADFPTITAAAVTLESQEDVKQPTLPAVAAGKINPTVIVPSSTR
jgi:hypothetical protein